MRSKHHHPMDGFSKIFVFQSGVSSLSTNQIQVRQMTDHERRSDHLTCVTIATQGSSSHEYTKEMPCLMLKSCHGVYSQDIQSVRLDKFMLMETSTDDPSSSLLIAGERDAAAAVQYSPPNCSRTVLHFRD